MTAFSTKLGTIQHIIIFWKQMLHYALKPNNPIKAIIFFIPKFYRKSSSY